MRAAPGTPQAAEAEGGALFARIVPKSNMFEAIRGETFELTLSKGYLTEIKDEAKAIGRGALIPRELECFEQARKVMRDQEWESRPANSGAAEGRILPCGG